MLSSLYSKLLSQTCFQIYLNSVEVFQRLTPLFIIPTLNTLYLVFLFTVIVPTQFFSQVLDFQISYFFLMHLLVFIRVKQSCLIIIPHPSLCRHWHILTLAINISWVYCCKILHTSRCSLVLLLQECSIKMGLFDLSSVYTNNLKIFLLLSELSYLNIYSFQCCILKAIKQHDIFKILTSIIKN